MKHNRLIVILFLFIACVLQLSEADAQTQDPRVKKANSLFDRFSFPEAAEEYKRVLAKDDIAEAKIKLADTYRYMNMPVEAEYWYEQVVELAESEPIHKYYYAMALKANGKFEEAKEFFLEYAQLVPADTRGLRQVEACEESTYFLTDPGIYEVSLANNINSSLADFGPAFYKEGIVYASEQSEKHAQRTYNWRNAPFLDLFYSENESDENPSELGTPESFKGKVNTWMHEGTVSFSKDFETMYFTRNNYFKGKIGYDTEEKLKTVNLQIYESKSEGDKWGEIKSIPFNSDDYSVGHPALSPDGQALYFASDMPGGYGGVDMYVSYRSGDSWGAPENLGPEINTEGHEMFPFMADDGTLYFASDALPGLGGLDLFSTMLLEDGTWSSPDNLRYPINTNGDDFAMIIDATNKKGYFSSNRSGGKGDDDIYSFTKLTNIMTGVVIDCNTQVPIEGSMVQLMDGAKIMQKKKTTFNGTFSFPVSPDKEYTVVATKMGYQEGKESISTVGGMNGRQINVKIPICPEGSGPSGEGGCEVKGMVIDKATGLPVSGAIVTITNADTRDDNTFVTESDGMYQSYLNSESDYVIYATKEFYFTANKTVSTRGIDCEDPLQNKIGMDIEIAPIPLDANNTNRGNSGNGGNPYNGNSDNPYTGDGDNPYSQGGDPRTNIGEGNSSISNGNTPNSNKTDITFKDDGKGSDPNHPILDGVLPQLNHIYYDFDKSNIRSDASIELDKVVKFMFENPGIVIDLRSHTDSRGTHPYNDDLSDKRAQSALNYITSRGVVPSRMTAKGYGENQLTNECADGVPCDEGKHQENRRTEFVITGYNSNAIYSLPRYFGSGGKRLSHTSSSGSSSYSSSSSSSSSTSSYDYNIDSSTSNSSTYSGSSSSTTTPYTNNNTPTYYDRDPITGEVILDKNCCIQSGTSTSGKGVYDYYVPDTNNTTTTTTTATTTETIDDTDITTDFTASSSSSIGEGTEYKIQLGAYRSPDMATFNQLNDLGFVDTETTSTGVKRVILGSFTDKTNVEQALLELKQRGYGDAFVVKYKNGLRIGR
ncbi:MAG: OmpA family protein [Chitinophagales bacterium]